ncbi:MAG: radical SAM/Cys-rich domain protein [Gammaproteobacteria bacterium]|nr:radical SAM/Cys-rich domain protein [Gammaproteobacteria bacterium]
MLDTWPLLQNSQFPEIHRSKLEILQVNLGYLCNQTCLHCHVNAGPKRTELMTAQTISDILAVLKQPDVHTLDLTGGAPEMNPLFRELVSEATSMGIKVIDRCNLSILSEPGYEDLTDFLTRHKVEIVASLPCYLEQNVDGQRGKGVYQKSIDGLQKLNQAGYAIDGTGLTLNLVYNPTGPYLPPGQQQLETDYKNFLQQNYQIRFNQLFTITNMPIARFGSSLISQGKFEEYMNLLKDSMNLANMNGLMCKNQLSIDWLGYVYDCDFNQMLKLNLQHPQTHKNLHIRDIIEQDMIDLDIIVADHCFGCTAGHGSSCGGALD